MESNVLSHLARRSASLRDPRAGRPVRIPQSEATVGSPSLMSPFSPNYSPPSQDHQFPEYRYPAPTGSPISIPSPTYNHSSSPAISRHASATTLRHQPSINTCRKSVLKIDLSSANRSVKHPPSIPELQTSEPIQPSFKLLFTCTTRRVFWTFAFPALILSVINGLTPPVMTEFTGQVTAVFMTHAGLTSNPMITPQQRDDANKNLLSGVLKFVFQLIGLASVDFVTSVSASSLWLVYSEKVAMALRREVFVGMEKKDLEWFDTGMGAKIEASEGSTDGTGGLVARFTNDTDTIRVALGYPFGQLVTNLVSFVACLVLSFYRSYLLAFVILVSIPLLTLVIGITERMAYPHTVNLREQNARMSSIIDRILSGIITIKAFNNEEAETKRVLTTQKKLNEAHRKQNVIWGFRSGAAHFFTLAMFVQGFWFGAYLIRTGKASISSVNTCFWACLLASTFLQAIVPRMSQLEIAKVSLAGILSIVRSPDVTYKKPPVSSPLSSPTYSFHKHKGSAGDFISRPIPAPEISEVRPIERSPSINRSSPAQLYAISPSRGANRKAAAPRTLRKISPLKFSGEMSLENVTFYYPSRPYPHPPTLRDVSMYFAAQETTYIVGTSGSGKSTVGTLLMNLYKPESGAVNFDDQGLDWLDKSFIRGHIGCVSQGASVMFEGTVHENVAIGVVGQLLSDGTRRSMNDVSRDEVIAACRGALIHDFIRDLPDGYDTLLSGEKGASLSGGQRQRIAIARAWLRNPTILILDEATSALDATSRSLVTEALKFHRKNKTTIIITHDLSSIVDTDFVYVLTNGIVAEQGYRNQLEQNGGHFAHMAHTQLEHPLSPISVKSQELQLEPQLTTRYSMGFPIKTTAEAFNSNTLDHRASLHPLNVRASVVSKTPKEIKPVKYASEVAIKTISKSAKLASDRRAGVQRINRNVNLDFDPSEKKIKGETVLNMGSDFKPPRQMSLKEIAILTWNTTQNRKILLAGIVAALAGGVCTPIFSSQLSKLMVNIANPDPSVSSVTSGIILLIAFAKGFTEFTRFVSMEIAAASWMRYVRMRALKLVVAQDKTWFDAPENTTSALSHSLIKDVTDAGDLLGTVAGQLVMFCFLILVSLVWAMVIGWEMTLVTFGVVPFFVAITRAQARLQTKHEEHNKSLREGLSKKFHQCVSNARAIRVMSLESAFHARFMSNLEETYIGGRKAAPLIGLALGMGAAMTYLIEALLFWIAAVLISKGQSSFAKTMEVFTVLIFGITIGTQGLSVLPELIRCSRAMVDFWRLMELCPETPESEGKMTYPIRGNVNFNNVDFAYPQNLAHRALKDVSFEILPGETIGFVGASGSGKSTIVALMQRLYEPNGGKIHIDGRPLTRTDVRYLRDHVAIVSQHPTLFDMTVSENIAYGSRFATEKEIISAAMAAQAHDFIVQLPNGYNTLLGENASLLSGGQIQRLQIARALFKERELLIFDECTSALDVENQEAVTETIRRVKKGKTTVIVTHTMEVMELCDRLFVMQDGRIVESGTMHELKNKIGGVFASLTKGGEWSQ